ncbi:hypothetical protein M427DRAFT_305847 [Gonapodya prolifera JEL478]|uniref:PAS domain-containing protein n=1 Tax=Gonapodya prolifera (strain JEL478) TaxID=1344416 RepID=A0A139AGQ9_GONPJ|nr:hypothetical protein M427DRAFT_305847 [Gonapodya prolifera JEL478]|eukprot:KXS15940.1 hypothetical protein M427DRAFT_305847 [Gonapodya prolifera JEL478]
MAESWKEHTESGDMDGGGGIGGVFGPGVGHTTLPASFLSNMQAGGQGSVVGSQGGPVSRTSSGSGAHPVLSLIDTIIDAVIVANGEGTIIEFNAAATRMFGWRKEEVVGIHNVRILMPSMFARNHDRFMRSYTKEGGKPRLIGITRTLKGQRRDGSVFSCDVSLGEFPRDVVQSSFGLAGLGFPSSASTSASASAPFHSASAQTPPPPPIAEESSHAPFSPTPSATPHPHVPTLSSTTASTAGSFISSSGDALGPGSHPTQSGAASSPPTGHPFHTPNSGVQRPHRGPPSANSAGAVSVGLPDMSRIFVATIRDTSGRGKELEWGASSRYLKEFEGAFRIFKSGAAVGIY